MNTPWESLCLGSLIEHFMALIVLRPCLSHPVRYVNFIMPAKKCLVFRLSAPCRFPRWLPTSRNAKMPSGLNINANEFFNFLQTLLMCAGRSREMEENLLSHPTRFHHFLLPPQFVIAWTYLEFLISRALLWWIPWIWKIFFIFKKQRRKGFGMLGKALRRH